MGSWPELTFKDAPIEIIDGDRGVNYPKKSDFFPIGHCVFLNAGNVTASGFRFSKVSFISRERDLLLRKGKLEIHDNVLTTRGTVGNVGFFDESVNFDHIRINSGMVILRPDQSRIAPRFLYLFLRSHLFKTQVTALATGSAQPQLPIRDISRIQISLPTIAEQLSIAGMLGALDDKIELNRRMNETLEAMARAIFKDWFVDFGPTRAKAEGRAPVSIQNAGRRRRGEPLGGIPTRRASSGSGPGVVARAESPASRAAADTRRRPWASWRARCPWHRGLGFAPDSASSRPGSRCRRRAG